MPASAVEGLRGVGARRRRGRIPAEASDAHGGESTGSVVWEVGPDEEASNQGVAEKGGPNRLEKRRMPELQELEHRSDDENDGGHPPGRELRPYRESQEAPEDHVEEAPCVTVYPALSGPPVELGGEAEGYDDGENQEKAKPQGNHTPSMWTPNDWPMSCPDGEVTTWPLTMKPLPQGLPRRNQPLQL